MTESFAKSIFNDIENNHSARQPIANSNNKEALNDGIITDTDRDCSHDRGLYLVSIIIFLCVLFGSIAAYFVIKAQSDDYHHEQVPPGLEPMMSAVLDHSGLSCEFKIKENLLQKCMYETCNKTDEEYDQCVSDCYMSNVMQMVKDRCD